MQEVSFVTPLHISSKRDYFARMNAEKPKCMRIAKQFGAEYWDGDRKYGYGGMKYDGRWQPIAIEIKKHYNLKIGFRVLDIGCGKGFLLYELGKLDLVVKGIDISNYAKDNSHYCHNRTIIGNCVSLPYKDELFDFTYSINVFHNLGYRDLKQAIREMVRVTAPDGKSYICVESYRNEEELCNLQMWALTCQSFYSPDDWKEILTDNGYNGDVEFIYFT